MSRMSRTSIGKAGIGRAVRRRMAAGVPSAAGIVAATAEDAAADAMVAEAEAAMADAAGTVAAMEATAEEDTNFFLPRICTGSHG